VVQILQEKLEELVAGRNKWRHTKEAAKKLNKEDENTNGLQNKNRLHKILYTVT